MRLMMLFVVTAGAVGCESTYFTDGKRVYFAERKYIQTERELAMRTPDGLELNAQVKSRVDAQGIKATGSAAAEVLGAIGQMIAPFGLKVGALVPGAAPTPLPPGLSELEGPRERLRSHGLDFVPATPPAPMPPPVPPK